MDFTVLSTLYTNPRDSLYMNLRKSPIVALVFSSFSDGLPHGTPQDYLVWLGMLCSVQGHLSKKGGGDGAKFQSHLLHELHAHEAESKPKGHMAL